MVPWAQGPGPGAAPRAGANMGSVQWETLTKIGTQKRKKKLWFPDEGVMNLGPGPNGPWAKRALGQTGPGPKRALGPNGRWAQTGPGPNGPKWDTWWCKRKINNTGEEISPRKTEIDRATLNEGTWPRDEQQTRRKLNSPRPHEGADGT